MAYTCECFDGFTDTDSDNPGQQCAETVPCCASIKISYVAGSSLTIWAICDKTDENNENYFSYDCHTSEVSNDNYADWAWDVPATIIYKSYFQSWFFMENISSGDALASNSISYKAEQAAQPNRYCPAIGSDGNFGSYPTECLEYYTGKIK